MTETIDEHKHLNLQRDVERFNQIYLAAKSQDETTLKKILCLGGCVDESFNDITPAGKLASEGNKKAVGLLMKYGASVNHIALGAAKGKHHKFAEMLFKKYDVKIDYIASGAALCGDFEYASQLMRRGATALSVACFAALGGYDKYAEKLRLRFHLDANNIAGYAAQGGHFYYVEQLIHDLLEVDFKNIARSAARGGHFDFAKSFKTDIKDIALGAVEGAYSGYAEALRAENRFDINEYARAAVHFGHLNYAEQLRNTGANLEDLMSGAAGGGHLDYLEYLSLNHKHPLAIKTFAEEQSATNERSVLYQLVSCGNDHLRKVLAENYKSVSLNVKSLLPKAKKIRQLMNDYDLNFEQALAWIKPEIQVWLLQGITLVQKNILPPDIFFRLAAYASDISNADAKDLYEKSIVQFQKKAMLNSIEKKFNQQFLLFSKNRPLEELKEACQETKNTLCLK